MGSVKRLMSHGDVEGSAVAAAKCLEVAVWLDTLKTEPRPAPIHRK